MRNLIRGLAVAAALCTASAASAGVYSDALGKCLVAKTSDADKTLLVQWVFASMSVHPAVAGLATASPAVRRDYSHKTGRLYERLMVSDCRAETLAALRNEGPSSLEAGFAVLGQVAMRNLMGDPRVLGEMQALSEGMDMSRLNALAREAGLPPSGGAPQPHP
jgi:hypothetical protein